MNHKNEDYVIVVDMNGHVGSAIREYEIVHVGYMEFGRKMRLEKNFWIKHNRMSFEIINSYFRKRKSII